MLGGAAVGWFSGWLGAMTLQRRTSLLRGIGRWLSLAVLGGMGASLFFVDSGYPLARPLQYGLGLVTLMMVAWEAASPSRRVPA